MILLLRKIRGWSVINLEYLSNFNLKQDIFPADDYFLQRKKQQLFLTFYILLPLQSKCSYVKFATKPTACIAVFISSLVKRINCQNTNKDSVGHIRISKSLSLHLGSLQKGNFLVS